MNATSILSRIWRKRFVRVIAWILGSLVTIYLLFCAWANYAGAKRWTDAKALLDREGETLDFRKVALEPAPAEKNFCEIAALKDLALAVDRDIEKGEPGQRRKRLN